MPWRNVVNPYAPIEMLNAEQVETIVQTAFGVLESKGIRFLDSRGWELMRKAGAEVDEDSKMVRFDRGLVEEHLAMAFSTNNDIEP